MNLHHYINDECIKLIHDFLGTEDQQRCRMSIVLPYLEESTKFVNYYGENCGYCYENAVRQNKKFGLCNICINDKINYQPYSFKQYRKINIHHMFHRYTIFDYELFKHILEVSDSRYYDYKYDLRKEIEQGRNGLYFYRYIYKDKYNNLAILMQDNRA